MNIFYLNEDPILAARDHLDKHVIKMISETVQLLSTAHRILDGHDELSTHTLKPKIIRLLPEEEMLEDSNFIHNAKCLKMTHHNHPCAKWVRESSANYEYAFKLFIELNEEKKRRYRSNHVYIFHYKEFLENLPKNIPIGKLTSPAQAMPDKYKSENPVTAYKRYYLCEKSRFATWKHRSPPIWYKESILDCFSKGEITSLPKKSKSKWKNSVYFQ